MVLVTAVVTPSVVREVRELQDRGYLVLVLYAGDGTPGLDLPGVQVFLAGAALDALEEHEPVLAD